MSFATRRPYVLLLGAIVAFSSSASANAQPLFWGAVSVSAAPAQAASDARVFVTVTNTSSEVRTFDAQNMCLLTDLVITDSHGKVQVPGPKCEPINPTPPIVASLKSNGIAKGWQLPGESKGEPLSLWGYRLLPGTYTIYAVPTPALWPGQAFTKDSGTADAITITLR